MIPVTPHLSLDEADLEFRFFRAGGPGGQNVNKVSTAVQLRFDVLNSALPEGVKARLLRLAGQRATLEGHVLITAQRFRTQERNRDDAVERLVELVAKAAETPKPRRPTRPTLASKMRRLDGKRTRSTVKSGRAKPRFDD